MLEKYIQYICMYQEHFNQPPCMSVRTLGEYKANSDSENMNKCYNKLK